LVFYLHEKKSTLADIRSRFMESNPKDTHKKRKKYPPCNHLPKSKLIFDVSSLCNYIEDDLLEDKDKTAQTSCMFKEENASEETNTIQKPRYAPVVILEKKKLKAQKKGTSKGAKITPKKPDSPKMLKKKKPSPLPKKKKQNTSGTDTLNDIEAVTGSDTDGRDGEADDDVMGYSSVVNKKTKEEKKKTDVLPLADDDVTGYSSVVNKKTKEEKKKTDVLPQIEEKVEMKIEESNYEKKKGKKKKRGEGEGCGEEKRR